MVRAMTLVAMFMGVMVIGACEDTDGQGTGNSVLLQNRSSYTLIEVNFAADGSVVWGPNVLDGVALLPGGDLQVALPCDDYDIRIVDDSLSECVLTQVSPLCGDPIDFWMGDNLFAACGF